MPNLKTECTELAVAFGLLGIDPASDPAYAAVADRFEGTLPRDKFEQFHQAYRLNQRIRAVSEPLFRLGCSLRAAQASLFPAGANVRWYGPARQSNAVKSAQDLVVGTTAVSVKENSRLVFNRSPQNLFVSLPSGRVMAARGPHWFLRHAPREYEALFAALGAQRPYASVREFEQGASKAERDLVASQVDALQRAGGATWDTFHRCYVAMCGRTASVSARSFNQRLQATWRTAYRIGVQDEVLGQFLRLDGLPYVLVSLERGKSLAVRVPGITEWKANWHLVGVVARPDLDREQSTVNFDVRVRHKRRQEPVTLPFHAEIRWSHGKFCGNPEAKLYRHFAWEDVPGFERLL